MRLLFVIFLICLLPVRGWTGTVMSMQMATAQVVASNLSRQAVEEPKNSTQATMPDDCPMRLGVSDTPPCSGCDTCELCLAIASFTTPQFHATPLRPSMAPAAVPHGFVSADRANRLKPPIS